VPGVERLLEHELPDVRQQGLLLQRLLRHRERDGGRHVPGRERSVDGQPGEPLQQLAPQSHHRVAERAGAVGAPGEVRDGWRRRSHAGGDCRRWRGTSVGLGYASAVTERSSA